MDENKLLTNEIKYLKLGKKPLEWIIPKTDGQRPTPRISATMKFYEKLSLIVIYGGSDKERKRFYNDLHIFDLEKLKWTKIILFNSAPSERGEHSCILIKNKLIIFGGINATNYVGSDLFIINFGIIV